MFGLVVGFISSGIQGSFSEGKGEKKSKKTTNEKIGAEIKDTPRKLAIGE